MNEFQQKYTLDILEDFKTILLDPEHIKLALETMSQDDPENVRYQLTCITDYDKWTEQERLDFSAAYAEAIALATEKAMKKPIHNEIKITQINDIQTAFTETYIPFITANTEENNRFTSVIKNIELVIDETKAATIEEEVEEFHTPESSVEEIKPQDKKEPKKETPFTENRFGLFAIGAAIVAGVVLTVAASKSNK